MAHTHVTTRRAILAIAIASLAGCAGGRPTAPPRPDGAAPSPVGSATTPPEVQQRIVALRELVRRNAADREAWVALGNLYYDTHERASAIEAYTRALELQPRDANVLSDVGVMYYELHEYTKAIDAFQAAGRVDARHQPSQFNLGVLYWSGLDQRAKAAEAFQRVIDIAPDSPQAEQARAALKTMPAP